ncbi:MAG TPA: DoxX family protein [Pyrinomonadaceae bacterium]|nr:DoxX family protein [Pyrinomonadaceae bacterium]
MADSTSFLASWSPRLLSIMRIVFGLLFMLHGSQKLLNYPAGPPEFGFPFPLFTLPGFAGALELIGGLLIILGLFTRPVAFILSGQMAVAYFMGHFTPKAFWPTQNGGELAVLYCFAFLYLAAAGGGRWSLDYQLRHRS